VIDDLNVENTLTHVEVLLCHFFITLLIAPVRATDPAKQKPVPKKDFWHMKDPGVKSSHTVA